MLARVVGLTDDDDDDDHQDDHGDDTAADDGCYKMTRSSQAQFLMDGLKVFVGAVMKSN